jgi:hypothetical protein
MRVLGLALLACIFFGCTGPIQVVKDSTLGGEIDLMVRPYQSIGVQSTSAIINGKASSFEAAPSDTLLGEDYPGRVRWNGWVIAGDEESFAQAIRIGIYSDGKFAYQLVVDKVEEVARKGRAIILSSRCDYAFDLDGGMVKIERERFLSEKAYRKDVVSKYGSPLKYRRSDAKFAKAITKWNLYGTDSGDLYSTHDQVAMKRIARINPGYGLIEKFVLKNQLVISTSPVAMVASIALSVFETIGAPSQGWDYMSQLPDRFMMGQIILYTSQFRLELIKKLNDDLASNSEQKNVKISKSEEKNQPPKVDNKSAKKGGGRK